MGNSDFACDKNSRNSSTSSVYVNCIYIYSDLCMILNQVLNTLEKALTQVGQTQKCE